MTFYHLVRNKTASFLMLLALSITFYFPMLSNALSSVLYEHMMSRAESTPLIVVAKGSRFQSVLNTIYFRTDTLETLPKRVYDDLRNRSNIDVIPIFNVFKSQVSVRGAFQSVPIIATTQDYLRFRDLEFEKGGMFLFPGEVVIGHRLAKEAGLTIGDHLLSEITSLINLNAIHPLSLEIVGILKETGTEDDSMIFSDLKSGWIMTGSFHGHDDPINLGEDYILEEDGQVTTMKGNVITYTQVNEANLRDFHFHGDTGDLPLTSIIVIPQDERAGIITAGRINAQGDYSAYRPVSVMEEFFALIFAINTIFNSYFILVMSAVTCFIAIIILLSARLRKDEFKTIQTLGGSRFVACKLFLCEYSILLASSLLIAFLLTTQTLILLKNIYI